MIIQYTIYFKGCDIEISKYVVVLSLKIVLITTKSIKLDEMPHFAAFHLGLHFLLKYQLIAFHHTK